MPKMSGSVREDGWRKRLPRRVVHGPAKLMFPRGVLERVDPPGGSRSTRMLNLQDAVAKILDVRRSVSPERCVLVAVSGIDGGGKGYVTARIVEALEAEGIRAVGINIDGWLNL